ncbi:hypothetical protein O6H91_02G117300 [Diphasiastrum complanatum]|uniref:Uncharacterized protein n=1 Tax=Diphasiastrum complanatum TaxID=34168 RepID=A0ACC2EK38_DIPCM|nr:hypothetical protein O6H91_02G117300 [Diphasiastrum complanatum]
MLMGRVWSVNALPFTFLAHLFGAGLIALVLVWQLHFRGGLAWSSSNKEHIFNIHPVLMLAGFIFLSSEVYKSSPGTKLFKKAVHLTLNSVALVAAGIGITAAFKYHNALSIDNLYSLHSWLGLVTVGFFAVQWIIGFLVYWFPGASSFVRARLLPWHVFLGLVAYVLAVATAESGILEKLTFLETSNIIGRKSTEARLANALGLTLLVFAITVVLSTVLPASTAVLPTSSPTTEEDTNYKRPG